MAGNPQLQITLVLPREYQIAAADEVAIRRYLATFGQIFGIVCGIGSDSTSVCYQPERTPGNGGVFSVLLTNRPPEIGREISAMIESAHTIICAILQVSKKKILKCTEIPLPLLSCPTSGWPGCGW